jgi:hypothetical protein
MKIMRLVCFGLMLVAGFSFLPSQATAQLQVPVDLELSVRIEPPYPWVPGTVGRQIFIARHISGGRSVRARLESITGPSIPGLDEFEFLAETCPRDVDCENFGGRLCLVMGNLLPQQTVQCETVFRAVERRQQRPENVWRLEDSSFLTFDPQSEQ